MAVTFEYTEQVENVSVIYAIYIWLSLNIGQIQGFDTDGNVIGTGWRSELVITQNDTTLSTRFVISIDDDVDAIQFKLIWLSN